MELSNNLTEFSTFIHRLLARMEVSEKEIAALRVELGMNIKNSQKSLFAK